MELVYTAQLFKRLAESSADDVNQRGTGDCQGAGPHTYSYSS